MAVDLAVGAEAEIGANPGKAAVNRCQGPLLAEKILVQFNETHDVGFRQSNFVGQLPRPLEGLFHAHGVHRETAVIGRAVSFPRRK